jgi:hypothetical protein
MAHSDGRSKRIQRPAGRQRRGITYKSYNFIDKDPIIYEVWDVVKGVSWSYIEEESGVSRACLQGWFYGATRKPQQATIRAVLRSVGYDIRILKVDESKIEESNTDHGVTDRAQPQALQRTNVLPMRRKRK